MQSPGQVNDGMDLSIQSPTTTTTRTSAAVKPDASHPLHRHADQLMTLVQRTLTVLLSHTPDSNAVQPGLKKAISGSLREAQILHRAFQEINDEENSRRVMDEEQVRAEIKRLEVECARKQELIEGIKRDVDSWNVSL
jgi:hypothetical protein